ncbi:MAG: hypothetical protein OEV94_07895 [Deltaproteobacteria bacterium]|nr:hypothetical protein [Deltaproteobacteria bacterium]
MSKETTLPPKKKFWDIRLSSPHIRQLIGWMILGDRVFMFLFEVIGPLALGLLVLSGEMIRNPQVLSPYPIPSMWRGMHLTAGLIWAGLFLGRMTYQGVVLWLQTSGPAKQRAQQAMARLAALGAVTLALHALVAMLVVSGLSLYLGMRLQVPPLIGLATLNQWRMIHLLSVPFFYALGVLALREWLRKSYPWFRAVWSGLR